MTDWNEGDRPERREGTGAASTVDAKAREAVDHRIERCRALCELAPNEARVRGDLGTALAAAGRTGEAVGVLAEAVAMEPNRAMFRPIFAACLGRGTPRRFHPAIRDALQICFAHPYDADLRDAYRAWRDTVVRDPETSALADSMVLATTDPDRFVSWADTLTWEGAAPLRNRFVLDGLRCLTVADPVVERWLTELRRYVCLRVDVLTTSGRLHLFEPILCALGEQCFHNQMVFAETAEETAAAERLASAVHDVGPAGIAVLCCYRPLHELVTAADCLKSGEMAALAPDYASLFKTHFADPCLERSLASTITSFGPISDEVSRTVRAQYEAMPYPRWLTASALSGRSDGRVGSGRHRGTRSNVLVAGCGSGRQVVAAAGRYPDAFITAIDVSRASLAYAMRKANEAGVADRVAFIHADILSMGEWPDSFDLILCSGVLHHMKDPLEGLRVLTARLTSGGTLKIGLYSQRARADLRAVRQFARDRRYPATTDGIRAFRQAIFTRPSSDPMRRALVGSTDFYSVSGVRDLVFHSHERPTTWPQIGEMLGAAGLEFVRLSTSDPDVLPEYRRLFPNDPAGVDLANWATFEERYPRAFAGMYEFWARKARHLACGRRVATAPDQAS